MSLTSKKPQSIAKRTAIMSTFTALSRVTGFLRIIMLAYALGATTSVLVNRVKVPLGDSFNIANVIPNIIFDLIAGGILNAIFVPIVVEKITSGDREEAWGVANSMINITAAFTLLISIASFALAGPITQFLTGANASSGEAALAIWFFRFFAWQIFFYGLCAASAGVLNAYRHFTAPVVAPLANNAVAIASGLAFAFLAPHNFSLALITLAVGTTLGVAAMAAIQMYPLLRMHLRFRFTFDFGHSSIKKLARLAVPVLGYTLLSQIGLWATNRVAWQYVGGITGFQYAWQFFQLPFGIFAVSIITAIFPELSEQFASGDMKSFGRSFVQGTRYIGLIMVPLTCLLVIFAKPLIELALQHGKFDAAATAITSSMLYYMGFGVFSFAVYMFVVRTFYAMHDTKTPMVVMGVGTAARIAMNYVLVDRPFNLGAPGLALSLTISYLLMTAVLLVLLRSRLEAFDARSTVRATCTFFLASLPLSVVSYYSYGVLATLSPAGRDSAAGIVRFAASGGRLAIAAAVGLAVYFGILYALNVEELAFLKRIGKRLMPKSA